MQTWPNENNIKTNLEEMNKYNQNRNAMLTLITLYELSTL